MDRKLESEINLIVALEQLRCLEKQGGAGQITITFRFYCEICQEFTEHILKQDRIVECKGCRNRWLERG